MTIDLKALRETAERQIRRNAAGLCPPQTVIALLDKLEAAEKDAARKPPCARHCESPAFEIEKRQLVRRMADYMEVIAKQRVAMKLAWEVLGSMDVAITSRTLGARTALHDALDMGTAMKEQK